MPSLDYLAFPIGPSSPLARAKRELWLSDTAGQREVLPRSTKYPFMDLEAGECFYVRLTGEPLEDTKLQSTLRVSASQLGKKYGRLFQVLHHHEHAIYEVHRIA
jgi:hypothetical protein